MRAYVPLSVREGNRRKRLGWWLKGRREALAFRLAPWLRHACEVRYPIHAGDLPPGPVRDQLAAQEQANAEAKEVAWWEYRAAQRRHSTGS